MSDESEIVAHTPVQCWCGNRALVPFAPDYLKCSACETLITTHMPGTDVTSVVDDEHDFYGRSYWFAHQENDLKSINIITRAGRDLHERCVYWLQTLLKYKLPPGRSLELGCGHGGFVALMRWIGFEASGLELSPWVVEFAHQTFDIPVLLGRVEEQSIAPASLDVIVLIDVLEHLPEPVETMRRCLELLKPNGLLLIQVPCYPAGQSYAALIARGDLFLKMLVPDEHLHLFSQPAIREFFARLNVEHLAFEPARASHDMIVVASPAPLAMQAPAEIERVLSSCPSARLVGALVDKDQHSAQVIESLKAHLSAKDRDLVALQSWLAKKEQSAAEQVAALQASLASAQQYAQSLRAAQGRAEKYALSLRAALTAREAELASEKVLSATAEADALRSQMINKARGFVRSQRGSKRTKR